MGRGTRGEGRGKACCEEQPLLTHPVSQTHTTEGGARDVGRGTKNNHCSLTLFLTLRKEGRGTWDEGRRIITVHSPCFSHYARRDEGRGTRNEEKRAARNNHCSLTLFLTLTLRKECEERGTNSYSLFTAYCSLFTIHCSLQRNIPMLLPRQLHRLGFEHPEGADQL